MARFNLAPSRLARYYFMECDRFLPYDAATTDTRRTEGLRRRAPDRSPVTRAILESGAAWEEHVPISHLPAVFPPVATRGGRLRGDT